MTLPGAAPPRTHLIGRTHELARLAALLADPAAPLITITGPGGVGKTRLAAAAGRAAASTLPNGSVFVPLAAVTEGEQAPAAIAHALGLRDKPEQSAGSQLSEFLQRREQLLVLDNLEQIPGLTPVLAELLRACPGLRVLATSRRPLHVQEERVFPLDPLPLPPPSDEVSLAQLAENAAVQLFVQRAQAVRPDFALTEHNAAAVAAICHRLDGLPLAIELGAARAGVLQPAALLAHLDARLALLTGGGADRPRRHQTMRDAIAWSYDLLTREEQDVFRRMAVVPGGFTLEAVQAVAEGEAAASGPGATPLATLDRVTAVVDASLWRQAPGIGDEPRFAPLETIREFGLESLMASEEQMDAAERHARYVLRLVETAATAQRGPDQAGRLVMLEVEQANVRSALQWALAAPGRTDLALRMCADLHWFWYLRSQFSEGRRWLEAALAATPETPSVLRARAMCAASVLAYRQGDYADGYAWLLASAAMCQTLHDLSGFTHALHFLAVSQWLHADLHGLGELIPRSVAQFRESGDRWGLATALSALGTWALVRQQYADAAGPFAESEAICRETGDTWGLARALHYAGELARHDGDTELARRRYEESLRLLQAVGHRFSAATVLHNLGYVAQAQGDLPAAMAAFAAALEQHLRYGNQGNVAHCLGGIAGIAGAMGQPLPAARVFGAASALLDDAGTRVWPIDQPAYERNLLLARRQLDEAAFAHHVETGRQRPLEESLAEARQLAA
ncbi:MAG: hypothetical protein QM692_07465, partial [Thermomicrobiales bacterium]